MRRERTDDFWRRALDAQAAQDARRGIRQPGQLFDVDKVTPQRGGLELFGLDDHRPSLTDERSLRFREPSFAAKVIRKRHAKVTVAARVRGPAIDVCQKLRAVSHPATNL